MRPAIPEGYVEPADKAACERIVRLLVALGKGTALVATRLFDATYEVQCFALRGGSWVRIGRHYYGQTEQDAIDIVESEAREAVRCLARQLRETAEAVTVSAAQQLAIAADKIARADALDAALR